MIKNIIFDLGNVLIKWSPELVYDKYFTSKGEKEEFYTKTKIKELNVDFDRGLPFAEGLYQLELEFPQYSEAIWLWHHSWHEMLGPQIDGTLDILQQLRNKNYNLYALTNWSMETFPIARERFLFLDYFHDIVVSGEERIVKPEAGIYQTLLKRNNLLANECVFIDDSLANVKAAQEQNIYGIHYKSPEQLLSELQQLTIL